MGIGVEFLPDDRGLGKEPLGRIRPGFLAVRVGVLREQLSQWGYEEATVRRQWNEDGLLAGQSGKLTRVVRLGNSTERCVVFRLP